MASTLPSPSQCCTPTCDEPQSIQVPGAAGAAGSNGTNGTDGVDAYTTFTVAFTMPAELASDTATVGDTSWIAVNQILYAARADGSVIGYFQATAVGGATSVTLKNLEDTASGVYTDNSAPGATFNIGSKLTPAGLQGPSGTTSGAAGGDLKGTYPNPLIAVANTKGSLPVGNGTDTTAVAVGTDGYMISADAAAANGIKWTQTQPITGTTDAADNRIPRLNGGTGLPIPLQSSLVEITDVGAIQTNGTGGNARGVGAVDLQVTRANATEVASGLLSTISGGNNNTASGEESFVGGGDGNIAGTGARATAVGGSDNTASGQESFIGGGQNHVASGTQSTIAGGDGNTASGEESFVGGGLTGVASGARATVAGGDRNQAVGIETFVGGGEQNVANGNHSVIGGGESNNIALAAVNGVIAGGTSNSATADHSTISGGSSSTASGDYSTVGGGTLNVASGNYSTVPGGRLGAASHYGEVAHASGFFAASGDAQTSELVLRRLTTDATPSELFLDGTSLRATIPTNTTWAFHLHTVARDLNGATAESAAWEVKGVISNDNGTTSLVAAVTSVTLADDTGGTWVHAVTADDLNDSLVVTVTGEAGRNIRWVCHIRTVQVTY